MAATATETASSTGVRYAPDDPSLPKPWRGLVDGKTGYLYFWNPETNVTQYEKPAALSQESSGSPYKSLTSSVQKSSPGSCSGNDGDGYSSGNNGVSMKVVPGAGGYQTTSSGLDGSHDDPNVKMGTGHGSSASKGAQSGASKSAPSGLSPEAYCRRHEISVIGDNVPQPFISFEATGLPSEILKEVRYLLQGGAKCRTLCCHRRGLDVFGVPLFGDQFCEGLSKSYKFVTRTFLVYQAGFSAPTPIQAQSWPIALQGRDIVAIAKTGSGKTLGYLIPGFIHLKQRRNNPKLGPTVLVLSPTRELATQIQDEAVKFGKTSKISCTCLYGGAPKGPQLKELDRGLVDVVVATPGRLNDILEMGRISLHQISYLVLDEADRMLDMGFEPQIRKIVKNVPTRRQTLMYTATWPKEVRKIASDLLVRPVQVNIGNVDELVANKAITQNVEVLSSMEKRRRLEQLLGSQEPGSKIIIFCSTKKMCDLLAGNLNRQFGAAAIHGDKSQSERDHVLNQFRTGRTPVLVATDVAARGLDIKDIRVVINYDFPTGIEDYVHRIGRTGRAGATGLAYTFFSDQDAKHASDLVKILEGANQQVPVEIRDMASRGGGGGFGGARRQWGSGSGGRDGGRGGRYDSGYGGRDGGRGGSHGYDCDQQEGYGYRSQGAHDEDALGSSHSKSFHESMMANMNNKSRSRSRSRSPNKNSGWGENPGRARSRSRSVERFDTAAPTRRSFHEMMMERAQSSDSHDHHKRSPSDGNGKEAFGGSYYGNDKQTLGRSPPGQQQGLEELAD